MYTVTGCSFQLLGEGGAGEALQLLCQHRAFLSQSSRSDSFFLTSDEETSSLLLLVLGEATTCFPSHLQWWLLLPGPT